MSKWIKLIWVSLYLEMIKYIRKLTNKKGKPDFENILLNRIRDWTVSARLLWSLRRYDDICNENVTLKLNFAWS